MRRRIRTIAAAAAATLPAGQTITSGWNATYAPASGAVTARNAARPAAFALNGTPCAVA